MILGTATYLMLWPEDGRMMKVGSPYQETPISL